MSMLRLRLIPRISVLICATIIPTVVLSQDTASEEAAAWETVQLTSDSEEVFAFIEAYPNGAHSKEAKALMIDLLWIELEEEDPAPSSDPEDSVADAINADGVIAADADIVAEIETDEVELRSFDNLVSLTGVIVSYDADLITIKTSYGVVGVENEGIECIGAKCPTELLASR